MSDPGKNLVQELRRGTLVLAVLSQLVDEEYGYSLLELLARQGVEIEQSTLYPLLRRLERQGLLVSEWSVQGPRPRRYYKVSELGLETLQTLRREWFAWSETLGRLLRKET